MFYTAIAAVSTEGAIGHGMDLAVKSQADMDHFVKCTLGQVVVMGYNTAKSLKRPLRGRNNYVLILRTFKDRELDLNPGFQVVWVDHAYLESALNTIATDHPEQLLFIIGGAAMYKECAPYCSRLLLTQIPKSNPQADVFFPKGAFSGYNEVGRQDLSDGSTVIDYVNPDCIYGIHVV